MDNTYPILGPTQQMSASSVIITLKYILYIQNMLLRATSGKYVRVKIGIKREEEQRTCILPSSIINKNCIMSI